MAAPNQTLVALKPSSEAVTNPASGTAMAPITVPKKRRSSKIRSRPLR
jgi:hypothetical protein